MVDTSRDFDREFFGSIDHTGATTGGAGIGDSDPLASTMRTCRAQGKEPLASFHLPHPAAGVACGRTFAGGSTLAEAMDTRFQLFEFENFLAAKHRLLKGDLQVVA